MPDFTFFDKPFDLTMQRRTDRDTTERRRDVQWAVDDIIDALSPIRAELVRAGASTAWIADMLANLRDGLSDIAGSLNRERDADRLDDPIEPFEVAGLDKFLKRVEGP